VTRRRSHPRVRALVVGVAVAAVAAGAPAAPGAAAPAGPCKAGLRFMAGRCMKMPAYLTATSKHALRKPKPPKIAAAAPVAPSPVALAPPPIAPPPAPVCQDSALSAFVTPFLAHLSAAHLQESPLQQVHDLLNTDQYVWIHTVLVDNMLAGLMPVLQDLLDGDLNGAVTRLLTRTCAPGAPATAAPAVSAATVPPPPPPALPGPAPMAMPMPMPMPMPTAHAMPSAAPSATVDMTGTAFVPEEVTVKAGGTVTWHNSDPVPHTITSVGSGPLASPIVVGGGDFSFTFPKPGTYTYFCLVHPNMRGSVDVQ